MEEGGTLPVKRPGYDISEHQPQNNRLFLRTLSAGFFCCCALLESLQINTVDEWIFEPYFSLESMQNLLTNQALLAKYDLVPRTKFRCAQVKFFAPYILLTQL